MPAHGYFKKRRIMLMEKDPHCHWCRLPLKLYPDYSRKKQKMPNDFPTIDHIKSRFMGIREDVGMKKRTLVISCPKCNHQIRNNEEMRNHPFRTHWKSGTFPYPFRWFGRLLKFIRKQKRRTI